MLHFVDGVSQIPEQCQGGVVSVGNFDGVHRGHAHLCRRMRLRAGEDKVAVAVTFDPHPVRLLRPSTPFVPLTWTERKAELLIERGIDEVLVVRTSLELLAQEHWEFFDRFILRGLQPAALVEGPNFRYGRNRAGSVSSLLRSCRERGIEVEILEPLCERDEVISSSQIRSLLGAGDIQSANRMLGHVHQVRGIVGAGAGRGTALGIPTANLHACDVLVPKPGVYAARTCLAGQPYRIALNIGPNPTFGETNHKIEAHILGYSGDLTGQELVVDVIQRIRDTQAFSGVDQLVARIKQDIQQVQQLDLGII